MMFSGLSDIEWGSLRHAFGPADEVPELIRRLVHPDERERDYAALELYGCLWHDGQTFEATPRAIPFMVELLDPRHDADRAWILSFLAHIAHGRPPLEDRAAVFGEVFAESRPGPEISSATMRWNAESRETIRKALPLVKRAAEAADPDVRASAAYLLSVFDELADDTLPIIMHQLQHDADPLVRAGAGIAATYLVGGGERAVELLEQAFEDEGRTFPLWVFAFVRAMLQGSEIPSSAKSVLWSVVADPSEVESEWARSPWSLIDCASMTCDACRGFDLSADLVTTHRLLRALEHADTYSSLIVADALLQACRTPPEPPWTDSQRAVLWAVANTDRVWSFNLNARQLMDRYDLPQTRTAFMRHIS